MMFVIVAHTGFVPYFWTGSRFNVLRKLAQTWPTRQAAERALSALKIQNCAVQQATAG